MSRFSIRRMKMKRLISVVLCAAIISVLSLSCFAASDKQYDVINKIDGFSAHSVYIRYVPGTGDLNKYYGDDEEEKGNYVVRTKGGLTVSIPDSPRKGLRLVVREVTPENGEAYVWFMKCAEGLSDRVFPLDIYYLDEKDNKIQIDPGTKVFFSIAGEGYRYADVYGLGFDGNLFNTPSELLNGGHRITTGSTEYYLLAGKNFDGGKNDGQTDGKTENQTDGKSDENKVGAPKTGDSDALLKIAVGLMILAEGFVLYFVFFALKRRKDNED